MSRVLSIDYGKKRTGIAVTDSLQIIANGLVTVATPDLMTFLLQYVVKESVEEIVIGYPMQPNGAPSENLQRVEQFVKRWRKLQSTIPIVYYDVRYTSVLAHRAIIESGIQKKVRRENKGLVDEISATILLQDYLQYKQLCQKHG